MALEGWFGQVADRDARHVGHEETTANCISEIGEELGNHEQRIGDAARQEEHHADAEFGSILVSSRRYKINSQL